MVAGGIDQEEDEAGTGSEIEAANVKQAKTAINRGKTEGEAASAPAPASVPQDEEDASSDQAPDAASPPPAASKYKRAKKEKKQVDSQV